MPKPWLQQTQDTLLAKSQSQDPDLALAEWFHTGNLVDRGKPNNTCQLCGHTGLRYHYLIANKHTGEALWVGSRCILLFDFPLKGETGKHPRKADPQKALKKHIKQAQFEKVLTAISELYEHVSSEEQRNIRWVMGKYRYRGGFSPAELCHLFLDLEKYGIQFDKQVFTVSLRSKQDKRELQNLKKEYLEMIWSCLSQKQKERFVKEG